MYDMAPPSNAAKTDTMIQSLFRSNHQLGVTTRFASEISQIVDTSTLTETTQTALIEFGLNGLFQIKFQANKQIKQFGERIDRDALGKLACLEKCTDKICRKQDYMMFCLAHFTLILDVSDLTEEQIDETKENLAMFCDIIDAWIVNYLELKQFKAANTLYKQDMLDKINVLNSKVATTSSDIKTQHLEISQNLLLMLASRFPMLGLDVDQEEEILDSIEQTINIYGELIEQQVDRNKDLTQLLDEAADCIELN